MSAPYQPTTELPSNSPTQVEPKATTTAAPTGQNSNGDVGSKTKSEAEEAADRLYEERIEEEYAKREGGA
ncbi:hypothetical protein BKA64DRAFT_682839 [Cadophora sp. MPI-SDFR-AT-0126]|nr:hypothetical protein BKA64DRAFT_682839 [Leotiomycetes sp. MPI-SDFR-AT-0126]